MMKLKNFLQKFISFQTEEKYIARFSRLNIQLLKVPPPCSFMLISDIWLVCPTSLSKTILRAKDANKIIVSNSHKHFQFYFKEHKFSSFAVHLEYVYALFWIFSVRPCTLIGNIPFISTFIRLVNWYIVYWGNNYNIFLLQLY